MQANVEILEAAKRHHKAGQFAEAEPLYRQYLAAAPSAAHAWYLLGTVCQAQGKLAEAETHLRKAMQMKPELAEAPYHLGITLAQQARHFEAAEYFHRALQIKPDFASAHFHLGNTLSAQGRFDEAEQAFRMNLWLNPKDATTCLLLANSLLRQLKSDAALATLEQAAKLAPDSVEVRTAWGLALVELGRASEAIPRLQEVLRMKPDHVPVYGLLSELARERVYRFADADIGTARKLLADKTRSIADQVVLHFALGYVLDTQGKYDEAFEQFRQGNELKRQIHQQRGLAFDIKVHRELVSDLIAAFPPALFQKLAAFGHPSETPVFIIGVPRSGTTLVNQILAAHPQVAAPGELIDIANIMSDLPRLLKQPRTLDLMGRLDQKIVQSLAERYLQRLQQLGGAVPRVTDKMPENYFYLGLIAVLFPKARVIHCRRNPLDTCVSCYTQHFQDVRFSTSLENLGLYYREYERLMAHWRNVLPIRMMEVQYEDLIARQEAVSRELIAHCGLEWNDRCLAFYEQPGVVHSASRTQTRQPVYTRSVERWKRYEAHLGPLIKALNYQP